MKKTDLHRIKQIALDFLLMDPIQHETMPFIVYHPFFNYSTIAYNNENGYELADISKEEGFEKACKAFEKIIMETKDVASIFMMACPSYQPTLWKYTNMYMGTIDYERILRNVWKSTEFPNHDTNMKAREWLTSFKKAKVEHLMNNDELKILDEKPDIITIYRGFYNEKYYPALSWTLDKKQAEWFSKRFGYDGCVYTAKIEKKHIFAYFDDSEKEVVVNYKYLIEPTMKKNKKVV